MVVRKARTFKFIDLSLFEYNAFDLLLSYVYIAHHLQFINRVFNFTFLLVIELQQF